MSLWGLFAKTPERRRHVRGLLRAFAYLSATSLAFGAWSVRSARAEMQQQTLTLGRQMMALARASNHDVTPITFNGQKMYLASSVTEDGAKPVLDRYEAHCKANPGQPAAGWKDLQSEATRAGKTIDNPPEIATAGFLRSGDDAEGTVVCFVRGPETKPTATEAFKSFAETGELGCLGQLRFVYAKKDPRTGKTLILTAWTHDRFNLLELMPEEGKDVPGHDFPELPRPPKSFRALSTSAEGLPYGLNVYKTAATPLEVLAFYDEEMPKLGFKGFDPELDEAAEGGRGRLYMKDSVVLTIATRTDPKGVFVALGLAGVADGSADGVVPKVPNASRAE